MQIPAINSGAVSNQEVKVQVDQQKEVGVGSEVAGSNVVDQIQESEQEKQVRILKECAELMAKKNQPGTQDVNGTIIKKQDEVKQVEKSASKSPEKSAVEKPTQPKEQNKKESSKGEEDEEAKQEEGDGENEVKEKEKDDKGENKGEDKQQN